MSDAKRKLSDCIRPTVEAAPWVIEAVLELENKLAAAQEELNAERNRRFEGNRISSQEYNDCQKQLAAALDDLEVAKNVANGNVEAKFDAWKQLDAMEHELAAALAACKVKDRALLIATDYADYYDPEYPFIAGKEALTIQPDDSALKTWLGKPVAYMAVDSQGGSLFFRNEVLTIKTIPLYIALDQK